MNSAAFLFSYYKKNPDEMDFSIQQKFDLDEIL